MNIIGTTFINVVNLQNVRKNPFLDTYYTYDSLKKTIFIACPSLFFVTSMIMLKIRYDQNEYCKTETEPRASDADEHDSDEASAANFINFIYDILIYIHGH